MVPKIISIHAPKAGGTSMLAMWKDAFGEDKVLMDYEDPPGNPSANFIIDPVGWAECRPTRLPDRIKVVHGHFSPHKYDLLKNVSHKKITFGSDAPYYDQILSLITLINTAIILKKTPNQIKNMLSSNIIKWLR